MTLLVAIFASHVGGVWRFGTFFCWVTFLLTIAAYHNSLVAAFRGFVPLLVAVPAYHWRTLLLGRAIFAEMTHLTATTALNVLRGSRLGAFAGFVARLLTIPAVLVRGAFFARLRTITKNMTGFVASRAYIGSRLDCRLRAIFGEMTGLLTAETARYHTVKRKAGVLQTFLVLLD